MKEITRNLLIIAFVLRLIFNYFQTGLPTFATTTLKLIGDGTPSFLLLCVGGGLALSSTGERIEPLLIAILMNFIISPAMVIIAGVLLS